MIAFAYHWVTQTIRAWWFCERHGLEHEWVWIDGEDGCCEVCGLPGVVIDADAGEAKT